jgi:hypothetical protein
MAVNRLQLIIEVDDADTLEQLPAEMVEVFGLIGLVTDAGWKMPGTKVVNGRRVALLQTMASFNTFLWLLGLVQDAFGPSWSVVAAQDFKLERPVDPDTGTSTGEVLGVHVPVPDSFAAFLKPSLEPSKDEDGDLVETPRPVGAPLSRFAGADEWVWEIDLP